MFEREDIDVEELVDPKSNPARTYAEQQVVANVTSVFELLREVTLLHVVGEYTLAEVAKELGISRSTAERSWAQAREILREHI